LLHCDEGKPKKEKEFKSLSTIEIDAETRTAKQYAMEVMTALRRGLFDRYKMRAVGKLSI